MGQFRADSFWYSRHRGYVIVEFQACYTTHRTDYCKRDVAEKPGTANLQTQSWGYREAGMVLCVQPQVSPESGDLSIKLEDQVLVIQDDFENLNTYKVRRILMEGMTFLL